MKIIRCLGMLLIVGSVILLPGFYGYQAEPAVEKELPAEVVEPQPMEVEEVIPTVVMEEPPPPPEPPGPAEPVPETAVVEDTYFDTAAFLGDSRTDGLRLYGGLGRGTFYYATGATVESVFTKAVATPAGEMPLLDALTAAETPPERIFVMLGVNELGWAKRENFHDYYVRVIERLRQDFPEADVLVQSILPVSRKQEAKKTYVNNGRIAEYNEIIRMVCGETDCLFLDVAVALTDEDGFLPANWTYDGVHLNKKGCAAWLDYLRTHAVNYDVYVPAEEESEPAAPETPFAPPMEPTETAETAVPPEVSAGPTEPVTLPAEPAEPTEPMPPPAEPPVPSPVLPEESAEPLTPPAESAEPIEPAAPPAA